VANIAKRPDGRWRARYRDEVGKEHARHFARKVDAQRWLDEVTAAVVTGQYVDPKAGRITFAAFYAQWSARQVWVPGTVRAMGLAAGSVPFADVPLARIRRSHIEAWVKKMETTKPRRRPGKTTLAPGTIRTRFMNVRAVFRAAVRDKLIAADPTADVTLPRVRRREAAMTIPTPEQVGAIIAAAAEPYRALIALAAFAGLRLGEAAAVRVADFDFLRRELTVARQVQRAGGGNVEVRAPKYGSERVVYTPARLAEIVARHIELYRPGTDPVRWLFVAGAPDQPPHQNTVGHAFRSACRRAGVAGIKLHDFRHYFASGLIAAGCDVVTVQRALGHGSPQVTLGTYAHLWPDAADRTRDAAAGLIDQALGTAPADQVRTTETGQGR
jgi:integrase